MTIRLALPTLERNERSITVAAAAERLGCDQTTVREMLRKKLLAGIRIGKTNKPNGVRVKVWSIEAWEEQHAIGGDIDEPKEKPAPRRPRPTRHNQAHEEAVERLKAWGV